MSGQQLHAYHWQEIPISDKVIDRVHHLAKEEKQPAIVNRELVFEWDLGSPIQDNIDLLSTANAEERNNEPLITKVDNDQTSVADDISVNQSSRDENISYDSNSDDEENYTLKDDQQQHSIDGFLEDEHISKETNKSFYHELDENDTLGAQIMKVKHIQ